MKKITIFAFIGFVFVAGMLFSSRAHAAEPAVVAGQEISAADAKILKQALDILGLVLKDVEARVSNNEFSYERRVILDKSLSAIEGSLAGVNYLVKNYAVVNYPGSGSLYVEDGSQDSVSVSESAPVVEVSEKTGLASLWATIWPGKLIGMILLLTAAWIAILNFRKREQIAT